MPNVENVQAIIDSESDLGRLLDAAPEYSTVSEICSNGSIVFDVSILIDAGISEHFQVRVQPASEGISVYECDGRFPKNGCPERHINFNGSLCLGMAPEGTRAISSKTDAHDWWLSLESHLQLQVVAEVRGRWKASREFSHGSAGHWQQKAEKLADRLGIRTIYNEGVEKGTAQFGRTLPKIKSGTSRLINQRALCPCWRNFGHKKLHVRRRCPDKELIVKLVSAEWERRKANEEFWKQARNRGEICCGTMRDCPLRNPTK